jgi:hypothetical protein
VEHQSDFVLDATEQETGGDQIPGVSRDNAGGEEFQLIKSVGIAEVVGLELAEISGAGAAGRGLHLDSDDAVAEGEGDVVGLGVSPGFEDFVAVAHGVGHEAGFDPFAALFEVFEEFEFVHAVALAVSGTFRCCGQKKRRGPGATPVIPKVLLSIFIISISTG